MKILATIESVEVTRKFQHQDGTWGNVYGVTLVAGDDKILAECWRNEESQKKAGIVPGAVGTAKLDFAVSRGTSKAGNPYVIGNIKLDRFDLANQNIRTEVPTNEEKQAADPEPEAEAPQEGTINPETGLPF